MGSWGLWVVLILYLISYIEGLDFFPFPFQSLANAEKKSYHLGIIPYPYCRYLSHPPLSERKILQTIAIIHHPTSNIQLEGQITNHKQTEQTRRHTIHGTVPTLQHPQTGKSIPAIPHPASEQQPNPKILSALPLPFSHPATSPRKSQAIPKYAGPHEKTQKKKDQKDKNK